MKYMLMNLRFCSSLRDNVNTFRIQSIYCFKTIFSMYEIKEIKQTKKKNHRSAIFRKKTSREKTQNK